MFLDDRCGTEWNSSTIIGQIGTQCSTDLDPSLGILCTFFHPNSISGIGFFFTFSSSSVMRSEF